MIASIHQPNFFPWLGYFDKINKSDSFIFLTLSQRSSSDKYFTRTNIALNGETKYLSIPFGKQEPIISDLAMPDDKKWIQKHLNLLKNAYSKSIYFEEIYNDIEMLYLFDLEYYFEFSINIIEFFMKKLNINTKTYIDLEFKKDFGKSNMRNINLSKHINATTYLSGTGAQVYNDIELFKQKDLDLIYQEFKYTQYSLSILDTVFMLGFEKTEELLFKSASFE